MSACIPPVAGAEHGPSSTRQPALGTLGLPHVPHDVQLCIPLQDGGARPMLGRVAAQLPRLHASWWRGRAVQRRPLVSQACTGEDCWPESTTEGRTLAAPTSCTSALFYTAAPRSRARGRTARRPSHSAPSTPPRRATSTSGGRCTSRRLHPRRRRSGCPPSARCRPIS
eukprot:6561662-Prymnesium_polylepis.2